MQKKKILVTGGNGYVGRTVTRLLYDENDVCIVDSLRSGQVRFRKDELGKFRLEQVDIRDRAATEKVIADFDPAVIIHLAAIHYIPECEAKPEEAVSTNVLGTINLLTATPKGARFVFASSGAVYKPDKRPHKEATAALEPSDIYGLSKLHGEQYVRDIARKRDLSAIVVRLFNVIGPGETNPHLLPEIVAQLKAGRQKVHLGNLWPRRDYIHVQDAARGFATVALSDQAEPGETSLVNLGTSRQYSVATVVRKLRKISQVKFDLEHDDNRARRVDRPFLAADNSEIRRKFGWEPQFSIDDALSDLWRDPDLTASLSAKYQL